MKFEKLNLNPKGIKAGDCVIRAIALATDQTWDDVYNNLCQLGLKMKRVPNEKKVYEKYLEQLGWIKHKQPRAYNYEDGHSSSMSKYTINELIDKLDGDKLISGGCPHIVVSVANHLTCLEDNHGYQIMDTWNCGNKYVCNYWTKE